MAYVPSQGGPSVNGPLRIGEWTVNPGVDQITRDGTTVRVETRAMRLLLSLARRPGDVVSIDELLGEAWPDVIVTPDSVYQAVTSLRRLLGDDPKQPAYIATVPRRGYRLIARVDAWSDVQLPGATAAAARDMPLAPQRIDASGRTGKLVRRAAVLVAVVLVCAGGVYLYIRNAAPPKAVTSVPPNAGNKSIAVLAFLDLTDTMNEEPFADGMTEELINRLSKAPGMKVAAPRSSFYYKDKQVPLADIARSLGVAYILDGSVRSSGKTMRVAARLVRAQDGFVIWSSTYDRPLDDKLKVQDEIASEVAGALDSAIK
ncbi:transcriptional regulator [Dyella jiangningensis]|nr:transcriptional regulator [Dyella jiangningensis]